MKTTPFFSPRSTVLSLFAVTLLTLFGITARAAEDLVELDPDEVGDVIEDTTTTLATERTVAPKDERTPWRIALGGLVAGIGTKAIVDGGAAIRDKQTARGGLVSLGYDFTRIVGVTAFTGGVTADSIDDVRLVVGGDVQFLPFRLPIAGSDVFELGMLGGASNLLSAGSDRVGWHVGARANVNLARTFGFTAVTRANGNFWMFEAGVTARL